MKNMLFYGIWQSKKTGAVIFNLFIEENKSVHIKIRLFKIHFQFKLNFLRLFSLYAYFLKGGIQLLNIFRIVCAVIIKLLANAEFVLNIGVIFPLEFWLCLFNLKRTISRTAPNKLCLLYGCVPRLPCFCIPCIVKPYNIKEVENIPSFVQLIYGKNCAVFVVFIFQRIDGNLFFFAFFLAVDLNTFFIRKIVLQFFNQVFYRNSVFFKVCKTPF